MKDLPKDLEFLAKELAAWPSNAEYVRLDKDGEICFTLKSDELGFPYDFFPVVLDDAKAAFIPREPRKYTGTNYTEGGWSIAREQVTKEALTTTPTQPLADPLEGLLAAIKEPLEGVLDHVVVYALQEQLKVVEGQPHSSHPEDIDYNKKLVKALKRVLHYYGIQG